jgi:hypothetical protein
MGIINKSENWWLRLSLVLFVLIALGSASVMNRSVTTERQILIDSIGKLNYTIDSIQTENFISTSTVGRYDMALDSFKTVNPKSEKQFQDILNSGQYE